MAGGGREGWMEGFFDDLLESASDRGDLGRAADRRSAGPGRVVRKFYLMEPDQRTSYPCF